MSEINALTSNVQHYYSKHQCLVALIEGFKHIRNEADRKICCRIMGTVRKAMDAIEAEFSEHDLRDFKRLADIITTELNS